MLARGAQHGFVCRRWNEDGRWRQALERGDQFGRSFEGFVQVVLVVVRRMHLPGLSVSGHEKVHRPKKARVRWS